MRAYLLTEKERRILKMYVEQDLKLNGYSVLMVRLKRARDQIGSDLELIDAALEKAI